MKITAVFHGLKASGVTGLPGEVASNPPLALQGMCDIHRMVQGWKANTAVPRTFDGFYSSRMARATDTASVLSNAYDLDFQTVKKLGQMANKEGRELFYYPGCENENLVSWQADAIEAVRHVCSLHRPHHNILLVSHRPIIGGLIAWSRGIIGNEDALDAVVSDPQIVADGYVSWNVFLEGDMLALTREIHGF